MGAELVRDGLQRGDELGWYRIERVLGRGGFGITYLATDTNLRAQFAIKEYLPDQVAQRSPDNSLRPSSPEARKTYAWGLERFVSEARMLARFRHHNIVRVFSVFETNGTAYMVMEYEHGLDLKRYLKVQENARSEASLKALFFPILDGLKLVHDNGFIHRDIKPSNIIVRPDGSPVLIDFGSARKSYGRDTRALTSLVSVGYAPLEQYSESGDGKQGPWTDIYACGAVLYYAISGSAPVDATQRGTAVLNAARDPLRPLNTLADGRYSRSFLESIDWALSFAIADRPANLDAWSTRLFDRFLPENADLPSRQKPSSRENDEASPRASASVDDLRDISAAPAPREPLERARRSELPEPDDWVLPAASADRTNAGQGSASDGRSRPRRGLLGAALVASAAAASVIGYFSIGTPARPPSLVSPVRVDGTPPDPEPSETTRAEARTSREEDAGAAFGNPTRSAASGLGPGTGSRRLPEALVDRLRNLRTAVAEGDLESVAELCDLSDRTRLSLSILFRRFDALDVDLEMSGPSSRTDGVAELSIRSLRRATGTTAVPAGAFRSLIVRARAVDGGPMKLML